MFEPSRSTTSLAIFNRQVHLCQDDAYTLAWYLLGDETQAEAVVQSVVERIFWHNPSGEKSFRLMFLQAVVIQSHQHPRCPLSTTEKTAERSILGMLSRLPEQERQALVLIDILNLNYAETAEIMRMLEKDLGPLLTRARRKLATCRTQPLLLRSHGKV